MRAATREAIVGYRGYRRRIPLARDRRGATIVEFAIVAAPFIALLIAVFQTCIVFFAQQSLETTAEDVSRKLLTGAAQSANMTKSDFGELACKSLPSFMTCDRLMVDVRTASSLDAVDTTSPELSYDKDDRVNNVWQYSPGESSSVVVMRTMYVLPVIDGPLGFSLINMRGHRRLLIATSVFKSEPYQ